MIEFAYYDQLIAHNDLTQKIKRKESRPSFGLEKEYTQCTKKLETRV